LLPSLLAQVGEERPKQEVGVFSSLIHSDWSTGQEKRWAASAQFGRGRWTVNDLSRVGASDQFLNRLLESGSPGTVLAGFDFPIGLPESYGLRTEQPGFPEALKAFGTGRWTRFFDVAEREAEIALERPFYPRRSSAEARQIHLLIAHNVRGIDQLRRRCELQTIERRAACPLFWTLGPNQVGKAAIAGWREIIQPALQRGARLWPFDGDLADLAESAQLVIAETYPAESYGHVGVAFGAKQSKRRDTDRAQKTTAIFNWGKHRGVMFVPQITELVEGGFGSDSVGEDRFDALMGLLGMMEVVLGGRPDGAPRDNSIRKWEGWILGQAGSGVGNQA
jgi:Protein of unknown function (DUF429)